MSFSLGPLSFHLYGLFIGIALIVGIELSNLILKREGLSKKDFNRLLWFIIIIGLMGARLYHVVDYWHVYVNEPAHIIQVWKGGLGIWGGLLGGFAAVIVYSYLHRKRTGTLWLDTIVLSLPISQAIGRVGNFVNQELYGKPTTLPWGISILPEKRLPMFENESYYHPLFAYELLLLLLLAGIMWWLYLKKHIRFGSIGLTALYFIGYGLIRFMLEPLRIEPWTLSGFKVAQVISLMVIGGGIWYLWVKRRQVWILKK